MLSLARILKTAVVTGASELWLTPDRPPLVRVDGALRDMQTDVLHDEEVATLLFSIAPDRAREEYRKYGRAEFGYQFQPGAAFRATMFESRGVCVGFLTPAPAADPRANGDPQKGHEPTDH